MLFKTINKQDSFDIHLPNIQCIGPKKIGTDTRGKPIYQFLPFSFFDEIDLDYDTIEYSAKTYFLPYKETSADFLNANKEVYGNDPNETINVRPIKDIVAVDIEIPGCPVSKAEVETLICHVVWDKPLSTPCLYGFRGMQTAVYNMPV